MLDMLLSLDSLKSITEFGVALIDDSNSMKLQDELRDSHLVFDAANLWTASKLYEVSFSLDNIDTILVKIHNEEKSTRILHLLQLVSVLAPMVSDKISALLSKTVI